MAEDIPPRHQANKKGGGPVSSLEEEASRTVLYVWLLGINQTLTEGLPKTLVSLSLQGRAQAIGAVVWGWLVPTLGEGWFTGVKFQSQL